jgi:hypothetical protein
VEHGQGVVEHGQGALVEHGRGAPVELHAGLGVHALGALVQAARPAWGRPGGAAARPGERPPLLGVSRSR